MGVANKALGVRSASDLDADKHPKGLYVLFATDAGRTDAVAYGFVARFKGVSDTLSWFNDGSLVCSYGIRQ